MQQKLYKNFFLFSLMLGGISIQNLSYAADTATGNLLVSANVVTSCTVQGGALNFNTVNSPITADIRVATDIKSTCANGTAYVISLNAGTGVGATTTVRAMTHTGSSTLLKYRLKQGDSTDATNGTNFGDTPGTTGDTVSKTGDGTQQSTDVVGYIVATDNTGAALTNGTYNDTVVITLTY